MKKLKSTLLIIVVCTSNLLFSQQIYIGTGAYSGTAIPANGTNDPNWSVKATSSTTINPAVIGSENSTCGYTPSGHNWEPNGSSNPMCNNNGVNKYCTWICPNNYITNPTLNICNQTNGTYVFERAIPLPSNTIQFYISMQFAWQEELLSFELIDPSGNVRREYAPYFNCKRPSWPSAYYYSGGLSIDANPLQSTVPQAPPHNFMPCNSPIYPYPGTLFTCDSGSLAGDWKFRIKVRLTQGKGGILMNGCVNYTTGCPCAVVHTPCPLSLTPCTCSTPVNTVPNLTINYSNGSSPISIQAMGSYSVSGLGQVWTLYRYTNSLSPPCNSSLSGSSLIGTGTGNVFNRSGLLPGYYKLIHEVNRCSPIWNPRQCKDKNQTCFSVF